MKIKPETHNMPTVSFDEPEKPTRKVHTAEDWWEYALAYGTGVDALSWSDESFSKYEPKPDLFDAAADRIGSRRPGYGQEDAFQDIADRWNLWLKQRFGPDKKIGEIQLTASDAADILGEFKQARRLVRARQGQAKRDDSVDQVGYIWFRDRKESKG